jgi:RNA polymerase sigma-70 factor (ECF subfamily)
MEDRDCIELARGGDLEAFNHLLLKYQKRVYCQAFRLLGESQAAEDASQAAFLTAFQKIRKFRGGSFRAWLLTVVTNRCYDELRREKRRPSEPLEPALQDSEAFESSRWLIDPGESPEAAIERLELNRMLQQALNALTVDMREIVVLVDIQGLDYSEAAQVIHRPKGTVKSRLSRGRRQMCEYLYRADPNIFKSHLIFESEHQAAMMASSRRLTACTPNLPLLLSENYSLIPTSGL